MNSIALDLNMVLLGFALGCVVSTLLWLDAVEEINAVWRESNEKIAAGWRKAYDDKGRP